MLVISDHYSTLCLQFPAGHPPSDLHNSVHLRAERICRTPCAVTGSRLDQRPLLLKRLESNGDIQRHDAKSTKDASFIELPEVSGWF